MKMTLKQAKNSARIYHPYWEWEETYYNMWGSVEDRALFLRMAVEFTGGHNLYGYFMRKVVQEWPKSCEHNLSNRTQNRRAWLGHAACALALQCPEDIVRAAWSKLSDQQRFDADAQADNAIAIWEGRHAQKTP